ncbi:MAG: prolipoprotein diacylglyceryl transferase, partial [Eubacteriales bacterium]
VFYLDLFKNLDGSLDWAAIFRISDGGMAIYGGIIAGLIVLVLFCRAKKISFFVMADALVVGLILGQGIGRWGNFMNVEAYGGLTDGFTRMSSSSIAEEMVRNGYATVEQGADILSGILGVHPTFFYESAWNFLGVVLLYSMWKFSHKFDGQICFSYFLWYGIGRFIIEGMRTDSLYFFGLSFFGYPLRTSQMLSLVLATVSGVVLALAFAGKIPKLYKKSEDNT